MNPEQIQAMFDQSALSAMLPLMAVALGILLLLVFEMVPGLRKARSIAFLGSLAAAFGILLSQLGSPAGLVLANSFEASPRSAAFSLLFVAATAISWSYARRYYDREKEFLTEHDVLMLTSCLGMMVMAGAMNLIVFFVGLELLSIPMYALCGFRRSRNDSVESGLKYFLLGAFGSAIFLYGAALLYAGMGSINLVALQALPEQGTLAKIGVALIVTSLLFKVSVFPFHLWVPDVYEGSATPVTTFMATTTKIAAFAFLLQMAFLMPDSAANLMAALAVITMAVGNLAALVQTNVKRMLAYSGIAHAGAMLLALAARLAGDPQIGGSAQAILYYAAAYVFTTGGAFGLISLLERDGDSYTELKSLRGLGSRRPWIAAAMALFMLSLGGIPLTGGFLGKYFVFSAALRAELYGAAIAGVLMSVIALGYYLRVIVAMYMEPTEDGVPASRAQAASATLPTAVCAILVLALGILPGLFLGLLGA